MGSVMQMMEDYLCTDEFEEVLGIGIAESLRGRGGGTVSDDLLLKSIVKVCDTVPDNLKAAIEAPDDAFVQKALKDFEKPRHGVWKVEDVPDLVQVVLLKLAASVDLLRAAMYEAKQQKERKEKTKKTSFSPKPSNPFTYRPAR